MSPTDPRDPNRPGAPEARPRRHLRPVLDQDADQPPASPSSSSTTATGTTATRATSSTSATATATATTRTTPSMTRTTAEEILTDLDAAAVLRELHAEHDQAAAGTGEEPGEQQGGEGAGADGDQKRSQASRLVALAEESYDLVLGADGKAYAVDRDGPRLAVPLRGRDSLRQRLARTYYARTGVAPSASALADALTVIEGMTATLDPTPVALRVARHDDASLVLDLGDPTGRAVVTTGAGWQLVTASPVLFRRTALTSPLPIPGLGADLSGLRELLNVDDTGFGLIVGWLLSALIPDIPHPILALTGEQGTAKSTAARFLVSLVDPSPAPLRTCPRDVRSWAVTAAASWTVALDNVSAIPGWLSDTLCRAVTGEGLVDRALYSDDDVTVLAFRRALVMTSIDAGALAGDLAERLVPVELHRIPASARRPDEDIENAYQAIRPGTLGALLDLLAQVLAVLPAVRLAELPRMADYARLLAALDQITGWTTLAAYTAAAGEVTEAVLDADPLATAVRDLMATQAIGWTGTAAHLLELVTPDPCPRAFPRTPRPCPGTSADSPRPPRGRHRDRHRPHPQGAAAHPLPPGRGRKQTRRGETRRRRTGRGESSRGEWGAIVMTVTTVIAPRLSCGNAHDGRAPPSRADRHPTQLNRHHRHACRSDRHRANPALGCGNAAAMTVMTVVTVRSRPLERAVPAPAAKQATGTATPSPARRKEHAQCPPPRGSDARPPAPAPTSARS